MEAQTEKGNVSFETTLCPIARNLSDEEVLELYHSGRMIYVEKDVDEEVITLMNKAVIHTLRCKHFAAGKSEEDVRVHYKKVFGGKGRNDAMERMRDASKRKQFVCENIGILMEQGVFFGKTRDIAKSMKYKMVEVESLMRYIRRGRSYVKKLRDEILQSV